MDLYLYHVYLCGAYMPLLSLPEQGESPLKFDEGGARDPSRHHERLGPFLNLD